MKTIEEKIHGLPPELKIEAEQFIDELMEKTQTRKQTHLRMTWAGALKDYRDQYTSIELQHKALEWWGD
jgi:hypothetical protein